MDRAIDALTVLGVVIGAALLVVGLGALVGLPQALARSGALVAIGRTVGALLTVVIGAGLVWLVGQR